MNLKHRLTCTTLAISNGHIRRHPIMHRNLFHPNGHRPRGRYDLELEQLLRNRRLSKLHQEDILEGLADELLRNQGFDIDCLSNNTEVSFHADLSEIFDQELEYDDLDEDDCYDDLGEFFDEDIMCVLDESPDECPACHSLLDANFCRECGYDVSAKADMGECALLQRREILHLHALARR